MRLGVSSPLVATRAARRAVSVAGLALVVFVCLVAGALAASLDFTEPASSPEPVPAGSGDLAAADLDGDGDQDLAVLGDSVTILRNKGNGAFAEPASSPVQGLGTSP